MSECSPLGCSPPWFPQPGFPRGFSRCWPVAHPSLVSPAAEKVSSLGKDWHKFCLKCERCNKTLTPGGHAEVRAARAGRVGAVLAFGGPGGMGILGKGWGRHLMPCGGAVPETCKPRSTHCGFKRCCCNSGCSCAQPWASHRVVLAPRVVSLLCHPGLPGSCGGAWHALGRLVWALHRLWRRVCAESLH